MGLFSSLFHSDTPEEKAKKDFLNMEKKVWKSPSRGYEDVLDGL